MSGMKDKDIFVIYGKNPKSMVMDLLNKAQIKDDINKNAGIGIKPNLVVAKPYTSGATTCPDIVEGIIEYLHSWGFKHIRIIEGS